MAAACLAALIQRRWVPRLRTPHLDDDDPVPDFTGLGSWPHVAGAFALAGAAGSVLLVIEPAWAPAWLAYITLGVPLVIVDLRTTYLPNQLMYPLWGLLAAGVAALAFTDPIAAAGAVVGALAAHTVFWCVWRTSRSFGFGDVRLAAAVGAVAAMGGVTGWVWALVLSTLVGAVAAVAARLRGRRQLPYGPWLWLGPVVAAWWPLTGS